MVTLRRKIMGTVAAGMAALSLGAETGQAAENSSPVADSKVVHSPLAMADDYKNFIKPMMEQLKNAPPGRLEYLENRLNRALEELARRHGFSDVQEFLSKVNGADRSDDIQKAVDAHGAVELASMSVDMESSNKAVSDAQNALDERLGEVNKTVNAYTGKDSEQER